MPTGVYPRPSLSERFWAKVDVRGPDECWPWTAGLSSGYGIIWNGRHVGTHRVAWELANGPISDGMFVLHRCDDPPCVNVAHLFLGTAADNNRDKVSKGRDHQSLKMHCPQGHPYSPQNTVKAARDGGRRCRICLNARARRRRSRARGKVVVNA